MKKTSQPAAVEPTPDPPERPAFGDFYRRHVPLVWRMLRRLGIYRASDREDLAQDIFIAILQRAEDFDPNKEPERWIAAFTWRTVQNYRRAARLRREQLTMDLDVEAPSTATPSPEEAMSITEQDRLLDKVLSSIPEERRDVLVLVAFEGMKIADAAKLLQIPPRTAYERYSLAKRDCIKAIERMNRRERKMLGFAPMLAAITDHDLDALFTAQREAPAPDVPEDVQARIWSGVLSRAPQLAEEQAPPESGTRLSQAHAAPQITPKLAVKAPVFLWHLTSKQASALLVSAYLTGGATGAAGVAFYAGLWPFDHHDDRSSYITEGMTETPAPSVAPAPSIAAIITPAPPMPTAQASAREPAPSSSSARATRRAGASTRAVNPKEDAALVLRAKQMLRDGKKADALALAQEHARDFQGGGMNEEEEALGVYALISAGRRDEARAEIERYRKAHPESLYLPDMERAAQMGEASRPHGSLKY
uniref:RNA polymerase ECF-type sigma factor n=1 Tax=Racemicystis crocea TaxID=1707966 RepID=A0A3S7V0N5_9BACT|nr:RNA polymerase ECF-type sigma factor [Racemicystis crocea]